MFAVEHFDTIHCVLFFSYYTTVFQPLSVRFQR